jgi:hypothetical protein
LSRTQEENRERVMQYVELVEKTNAYDVSDFKRVKNFKTNQYLWKDQDGKLVVAKYDTEGHFFHKVYEEDYTETPTDDKVETVVKKIEGNRK